MAKQQRLISMGQRRGERLLREFAEMVREARIGLGLSLRRLSDVVGLSRSKLWRIENGRARKLDLIEVACLCQVLGLDLSIKAFPTGAPLRDAGHVRLIQRFTSATPNVAWSLERPIPMSGDLRAWDAFARVEGVAIGVAAETRLHDEQELLRREHLKMRDSGVERLILLVAGTHANRAVLRDIRESLRSEFPLDTREVLAALKAGRDPGASGIVLL